MFGPYEIEYDGRRYFGNVSLTEFHIFDYEGNNYLVDVKRKTAHLISPRLAAMISRVSLCLRLSHSRTSHGGAAQPQAGCRRGRFQRNSQGGCAGQIHREDRISGDDVALFVAQECNMRCVYCYGVGGEYGGGGLMSEETALRAVDWLMVNSLSARNVDIGFFGGEPLLNFPLMQKVVSYARAKAEEKGKQVNFGLTTNGSILSDEIITFLRDEKIDPLISFDGPPEYQNRQRPFKDGSGSYDKILANVRKLSAALPRVRGRATLFGDGDPFRIKEAMEHAGFTTFFISEASPVILSARPAEAPLNDDFGGQTLERMTAYNCKEVDRLLALIKERKIEKDAPPVLLSAVADMVLGQNRGYGCAIGKTAVAVSVTGDIYPCHRFVGMEEARMGNIADYRVDGLNVYHRAVVDHLPECRKCWARYYCGGGCFYHNMALTGDMHRPDPFDCRGKKALYERLIHVYSLLDEADRDYLKDTLKEIRLS